MIGKPYYYIATLPKEVYYPLDSIIDLGKEHNYRVVKVTDILEAETPGYVIYIMKPLFWRTKYRKYFGVLF